MSIWTKTSSGWVEIGGGGSDGLEGLGGWAEITEVTGSPKRYAYNDGPGGVGGFDWVAFEWTQDGSVTTQAGGLVDAIVMSGGGGYWQPSGLWGSGKNPQHGIEYLDQTNTVTVGGPGATGSNAGNIGPTQGGDSVLGAVVCDANGAGVQNVLTPYSSFITGQEVRLGGQANQNPAPKFGGAATNAEAAQPGVVIIRVPAAQAAGVDPGSWVTRIDYYAEVTDGIVTDLYQERFYGDDTVRTENGRYASPEQPDDLIPCDPTVAEGWTYADGEFTPPPPDPSWREEAIKALKEQIKDLQKDT